MIIDLTKCEYQKGYLPKAERSVFHPFFATANAAFRRTAVESVGRFDTACMTGEDLDICVRVAQQGYELWHQPSARVVHHDRKTVAGVLKQFFGYGFSHGYLFRKYLASPRLQLYRYRPPGKRRTVIAVHCFLNLPSPIYGMVYVGSFQIFHLASLAALICALAGIHWAAWSALAVAVCAAFEYCRHSFELRHPLQSLQICGLWYLIHGAYSLGGFLGGLKHGVLFVQAASRRPKKSREPVQA